MQAHNTKKLEMPRVPPVFRGRFPRGFVNDCKGWNFSATELAQAAKAGSMLTMDLDMVGEAKCSLRCRHCFNTAEGLRKGKLLSDDDVMAVVRDAAALGLRSVKIIGPGEPLDEPKIFEFLGFLAEHNVQPLIFTRAVVIGDDERAKSVHGTDSEGVLSRLDGLGVSILLGSNSFRPGVQAGIVGQPWYPAVRNRALERLAEAGFNRYAHGEPTRLGLIMNPITTDNSDEIFQVYKWARRRNMYVVSSPTMIAGNCREAKSYLRMTPTEDTLMRLYVEINLWAVRNGLFSVSDPESFREYLATTASPYVGVRPCQQLPAGVFVRRDGAVLRCPGDDVSIQGRIGEKSLGDIWAQSENLRRFGGRFPYGCPPKEGRSFPPGFLARVAEEVKRRLREAGVRLPE